MYKLNSHGSITRTADGAFIPADPENTDYAAYLAWLAEGNTPKPADAPDHEAIIEAKKQAVRAVREVVLGRLLGIKDAARDDNDLPLVEACRVARLGLLDITKDLPPDPQLAELTMMTRYVQIRTAAAAVSPSLEGAFAQAGQ